MGGIRFGISCVTGAFYNLDGTTPCTNTEYSLLFSHSYENYRVRVNTNESATLQVDLTTYGEYSAAHGMTYSNGEFWLGFYNDARNVLSVEARVYNAHTTTWSNWYTGTNCSVNLAFSGWYKIDIPDTNWMSAFQIRLTTKVTAVAGTTGEIYWNSCEFRLYRPSSEPQCAVDKFTSQSLYLPWYWKTSANAIATTISNGQIYLSGFDRRYINLLSTIIMQPNESIRECKIGKVCYFFNKILLRFVPN
jgi:hypothetical protein